MKRILLVSIMLAAMLLSACGGSTTETQAPALSQDIEQQIYAIVEESSSKYISISNIEDDGSICRINLELLFEPLSYSEVKTWTDAVCYETHDIFEQAGIQRDISVWGRRTLTGDRVALYGRTFYSKTTGKYEFKNVDELGL